MIKNLIFKSLRLRQSFESAFLIINYNDASLLDNTINKSYMSKYQRNEFDLGK